MADVVAVTGVAFVQTSVGDAAAQAVRLFAVAEAVDEGAQLTHVVHFPGHHHFLVDDVGLRQVRSLLDINEKFPEVSRRHHDGSVELDHVALVQCDIVVRCQSPVEVVNDVGWVAASEVWDRHGDLLIVVSQINAHVLFQLLTAAERSVHRVLVQHPAAEQVLLRDMGYEVVAVDIDGCQNQTSHEDHQPEGQATQSIQRRPFGSQRQNQLLLLHRMGYKYFRFVAIALLLSFLSRDSLETDLHHGGDAARRL